METAIHVRAAKETIDAAHHIILAILDAAVDQSTKVCALETLGRICQITNTSIMNDNSPVIEPTADGLKL